MRRDTSALFATRHQGLHHMRFSHRKVRLLPKLAYCSKQQMNRKHDLEPMMNYPEARNNLVEAVSSLALSPHYSGNNMKSHISPNQESIPTSSQFPQEIQASINHPHQGRRYDRGLPDSRNQAYFIVRAWRKGSVCLPEVLPSSFSSCGV